METATGTARTVNALAARWARELGAGELGGDGRAGGTVFTAVGLWPLLAFLATGANEHVRKELEEALGLPVDEAAARGRDLLAALHTSPGLGAALGLWTRGHLQLEPDWLAGLGPRTHGTLTGDTATDRAALDGWAAEHADGLIRSMPLRVDSRLLLVLASALTVRTRWRHPFQETWRRPESGPWTGRTFAAVRQHGPALFDRLAVAETAAGPVTEVRVPGTGDIDVHLILGTEDAPLGAVLAAGLDLLDGRSRRIPAAALPLGAQWPGLVIGTSDSATPENRLDLTAAAFTVDADHDLLERADLFGLRTASRRASFPGICRNEPLAVAQARQAATAVFGAAGFEAAAVTVVAAVRGGPRPPQVLHRVTAAAAGFERPFAFLAVHRPSGLALTGGWITDPATEHPS
ncbi:serpin family protein [Kitasatospora sp. NPDC085879]|uniref:serpin family protein n=1 Tax=Kitasatospora sp. NPDC085879 TaxID=3154769 RepID=UPI0034483350